MLDIIAILAQAVPTTPIPIPQPSFEVSFNQILNALGVIAQYGLLGAFFILSLAALYRRDKELQNSWQARLTDANALKDIITSHTVAMSALTKSQETLSNAQELQSEAQKKTAAMLEIFINQQIKKIQDDRPK